MKKIQTIQAFDQIKTLADPRRMEILRLLMAQPATLTQLAQTLKRSPAWVRHHILVLESAQLIELSETRITGKVTEKFYSAKSGAFFLQEFILPKSDKPAIIFSGSHDLAIEKISEAIAGYLNLLTLPVGSLDGLANLRQGVCQISGTHLLGESGEYNTPFVRSFFPDRKMDMITLAYRTQGLIVAPGNPLGIHSVTDLTQTGLRFINRNPGSGTRLWLDKELKRLNIPLEAINGYDHIANTHTDCAQSVLNDQADAALGLQASAHEYGLGFIPLLEERYDLVLPCEQEKALLPLLEHIQTKKFRETLSALTGYSATNSGEAVTLA